MIVADVQTRTDSVIKTIITYSTCSGALRMWAHETVYRYVDSSLQRCRYRNPCRRRIFYFVYPVFLMRWPDCRQSNLHDMAGVVLAHGQKCVCTDIRVSSEVWPSSCSLCEYSPGLVSSTIWPVGQWLNQLPQVEHPGPPPSWGEREWERGWRFRTQRRCLFVSCPCNVVNRRHPKGFIDSLWTVISIDPLSEDLTVYNTW